MRIGLSAAGATLTVVCIVGTAPCVTIIRGIGGDGFFSRLHACSVPSTRLTTSLVPA